MTTTAFFTGAPAAASPAKRAVSAALKAPRPAAGAPVSAYPWLTAGIRRNMSARALRLMRADY